MEPGGVGGLGGLGGIGGIEGIGGGWGVGGVWGLVRSDGRPSQGPCRAGSGAAEGEVVATGDGFGGASLMVHLICLPMIDAEVGEGPAPHL